MVAEQKEELELVKRSAQEQIEERAAALRDVFFCATSSSLAYVDLKSKRLSDLHTLFFSFTKLVDSIKKNS